MQFAEPEPQVPNAMTSSDKFVEQMYQQTIERHQDLNTTGRELSVLSKTPGSKAGSNLPQKRKRMTETQPFEFETHKRAKFSEGLQQNDMASELDG